MRTAVEDRVDLLTQIGEARAVGVNALPERQDAIHGRPGLLEAWGHPADQCPTTRGGGDGFQLHESGAQRVELGLHVTAVDEVAGERVDTESADQRGEGVLHRLLRDGAKSGLRSLLDLMIEHREVGEQSP